MPGLTLRALGEGMSRPEWNDSRTAWLDERGDLKQAWIQDCVNDRRSDGNGLVLLPGVLPERSLVLTLEERWYRADRTVVSRVSAGQTTRHEDIQVKATGDAKFVAEGLSDLGRRRVILRPSNADWHRVEPIDLAGHPATGRATHLEAGPWSAIVQMRTPVDEWEVLAKSTIHIAAGEEVELRVIPNGLIEPP